MALTPVNPPIPESNTAMDWSGRLGFEVSRVDIGSKRIPNQASGVSFRSADWRRFRRDGGGRATGAPGHHPVLKNNTTHHGVPSQFPTGPRTHPKCVSAARGETLLRSYPPTGVVSRHDQ